MPVIINPGSGPVPGADRRAADENMTRFVEDLADQGIIATGFLATPNDDYGDGRYAFRLNLPDGRTAEVQMPGLPLDQVRWMNEPDQNFGNYPRLFVDGSSWVWWYALDRCGPGED
ncbi:hypothetical protein ACFC6U_27900 [Kitasatospora purpeofusca]|uniref:hypothetical protein n=1 Tax=Kitasatospora purpeofusca TaxID=67352 RepID=UPI0035DC0723